MTDSEHEEWLEDERARKAAAQARRGAPVPPHPEDEAPGRYAQPEEPEEEEEEEPTESEDVEEGSAPENDAEGE